MLNDLRVLDLTDEKGWFCGKILADLGADVIKVERPGGDPGRRLGPFYGDEPHPEKSLLWCAYNGGKKGITLDLENEKGAQTLSQLVLNTDFFLESFSPGYLTTFGLGYDDLSQINPKMIYTSISPYGHTGPFKDYPASDITSMAMSGLMKITGYQDRAPLLLGLDQSYGLACTYAAIGTLVAHYARHRTGRGQHVDVSIFECTVLANYLEPVRWEYEQRMVDRMGDRFSRGKGSTTQVWRCRDGYVTWTMMGGEVEIQRLKAIVERMDQEGMAGYLKNKDLEAVHLSQLSEEELRRWEEPIQNFFLKHTKKELESFSNEKNLRLCVINELDAVAESEHLKARGFWQDVEYPEFGRSIQCPGYLFNAPEMNPRLRFKAPRIGEHNEEILGKELEMLKYEPV
ncbi:MAG: CoA transferase [Deltaproteobacteria bacterium]|nr:CoA transferase [Deltaproteobacteria bacterium]